MALTKVHFQLIDLDHSAPETPDYSRTSLSACKRLGVC
jgi:hypothetical protein